MLFAENKLVAMLLVLIIYIVMKTKLVGRIMVRQSPPSLPGGFCFIIAEIARFSINLVLNYNHALCARVRV
jgi:hypothetical protein